MFWNVNYLLMKNTNEADSPFSLPSNNFNLRADRGPSATDFRHLISGFISKRLPRGFAVSTIFQATSALPYNITTGFDDNGDTVINDRPIGVGRNSARGAARWEIGSRFSWGTDFGPEQQQTGGPQIRMVRVGGGDGAAPPSIAWAQQEVPARVLRAGFQSSEPREPGCIQRRPNLPFLRPGHFSTITAPHGTRDEIQLLVPQISPIESV